MTKTYKAASYYTSARPRSKQLRECGSTTSNSNSSSARNNTTTIYNTTEGHTHDNKDDLDKISIDTNRYIYVTQTEELADGTSSTTNEKAKAGYADEAGTAAEASHAATADTATTAEIANDLADNAPILDTVLRSNQEDTAQEIITFLKGLKLGEDGLYYIDGEGIARLQKLIVETISSTNINNAENISTKDLSVTGTAHFFQLIIDKLNSVEGAIIATNAHAKINRILWLSSGSVIEGGDTDNVLSSTNYAYHDANPSAWDTCRLLWKSTDDNGEDVTNTFAANDGIVCWDTKGLNAGASFGATNKFYWCKVYATGTTSYYDANGDNTNYNYIDILATDVATNGDYYDGAFRPAVFDNTSQLGFFGSDSDTLSLRGNALILSAYATPDQGGLIDGTQYDPIKPPSFVQYKEIKTCSLAPYRMNVQAANGNIFKGAFVAIAASGDEYEITKGTAAMTLHAFKNFADSETASIPTNATYNFATHVFYPGDNGWSADVPAAADGYTTYVTLAVVSGSESNDCAIDVTSWVTPYPNSGARGEKGEKGEKGDNGDDGDTPTIGSDGYWYINGVSTGIKAEATNGTSVTITDTSVTYQVSTSGTDIPTGTWQTTVPTLSEGQYLWSKTTVTYSDEKSTTTYGVSYKGKSGTSVTISSATVTYSTVRTSSQPADSTFTLSTFPTDLAKGDYLWSLTKVVYSDGTTTKAYDVSRIGKDGDKGDPGSTGDDGKTSYVHFAYATSSDGKTNFNTSAFTGALYIGTYTDFTEADSTTYTDYTWSRFRGEDGDDITITNKAIEYATSTSGTTAPTSNWQTSVPTVAKGSFLWTRTTITYSTGTSTVAYSVGYTGENGTSVTVSTTSVTYAVNQTGSQPADSEFTYTTIPALSQKDYLWTRTYVKYSDNTETNSYSVGRIGADGDKGEQGATGADGKTSYVHFAYATSSDGKTGFSTTYFTGALYVGTCTDYDSADPTTYSSYEWARLRGEDGTSVTVSSTSVTYSTVHNSTTQPADSTFTLTAIPTLTEGQYLWSKTTVTYSDEKSTTTYAVSRIGENGEDGTSVTVSSATVTYSTVRTSSQPADSTFTLSTFPTDLAKGDYLWSLTKVVYSEGTTTKAYDVSRIGKDGDKGDPGSTGDDGKTSYVHFAYATSSDGKTNFNTSAFTGALYIGTYTDFTEADSTTYTDYTWSRFRGEDGKAGTNAITLDLDNEADIMQYDSAGNLVTTDGVSTTATMYDGATAVDASSVTWTYEVTSGTASVTQSTNTFTVTAMSTETVEVTIKATYNSVTYTKIFSVKKITGTDKYELVLSDNAVRCTTSGTATPSSITIQVYRTDSNGTREDISSTLISGNGSNTYGLQVLLRQYMNDSYYNTYGQWNDTSYYEAMTFPCTDIYKRYVALLQSSDGTLTYDTETIPVLSDGEGTAGKSYNASLNSLVVKCTINSSNNYIIASDAADSKIYLTCSDSTVTASSVVVTSGSATSGTTLTTSSQYLNNIGYSFSTSNQYIALAMNTNGTLTAHSDKIVVTWSDGVTSTHSLQVVPLVDGSIEDVETTTVYRLNPLTETALIKLSGGGTTSLSQTLNVSLSYSILKVSGETESVLSSLPSGYAISGAYNNGTTISFSSLSYTLSGGSYSSSDGRNTIVVTLKNSNSVVVDARTIPIVFEQTSALSVTSAGITAISQNATDISTIEQTASSLQSTVSTLSGQMSTIEQKADSIALKVSNGTLDSKRWNLIDNAYLNTAFFNNLDSSRTMVLQAGHTYTMTVCGKALTNNTILRVFTYALLSNTYWVGFYYIDISSTASTTASVTFTVPTSFSSSETSATLTYSEGDSVTYYLSPYIYNSSGSTSLGSSYKAFIEWVVIEEGSTSSGQYLLSETDPYASANMLSGIQSCTSGDSGTSYIQNNGASVSTSTVTLGDIDFYYWYKTGVASTVMLQAENLYDMERYGVYTLSFWAKGSSSSAYLRVIFPSGTSASGIMSVVSSQGYAYCSQGYVNVTLTTSWVRYWVTFFHNGAYSGAGFSLLTMNTYTYYVAGLKLCKGGRIDDWTDYGVSAMSEDGANIYSYIQQTESKISLRVASLESTSELLVKDNKIIAKTNTFEVQDSSGNTTFAIDDNGNLNSSGDAAFSGKVTASSGSIGDFNISDGSLTNSDTTAYLQFDNSYYNIKIGGDKAVGMQITDNGAYDSFLGAYFKADVGLHSNYHFIADGEMQCLHQTPTTGSTITLSNKYNGSVITGTGTLTINAAYSNYLNVEMFAASSCTLAFQRSDSYTYFKHGSTTAASLSISVSAYQIIRIFSSGTYIYIALISTS